MAEVIIKAGEEEEGGVKSLYMEDDGEVEILISSDVITSSVPFMYRKLLARCSVCKKKKKAFVT